MSLVYSSFAAMRRSLMPVRVVIHSSVVSTISQRSALVRTRSGT